MSASDTPIRRYEFYIGTGTNGDCWLECDPHLEGRWVSFADHEATERLAAGLADAMDGATGELADNLDEWVAHFRENQHGATLTLLRVSKMVRDAKAALEAWRQREGGAE